MSTYALDYSQLAREIIAELEDTEHANRTHGRIATYNAKCRGPLCKKALRDRMRQHRIDNGARPHERSAKSIEIDALLEKIIQMHHEARERLKNVPVVLG